MIPNCTLQCGKRISEFADKLGRELTLAELFPIAAADLVQHKNWHSIGTAEKALVDLLVRTGYLKKSSQGFTGAACLPEIPTGPKTFADWYESKIGVSLDYAKRAEVTDLNLLEAAWNFQAGQPCVPPETEVITTIGTKAVEDLETGDEILSPSHWENNSDYPVEDWRAEVANNDTRLGYLEWIEHRKEADNHGK